MSKRVIKTTDNYQLFERSPDNRQTDAKKHKKLEASMQRYGFIPAFPIVCRPGKNEAGKLVVKDGQHRLMLAETLGIPVHYVEEDIDFDIACINTTAIGWKLRDFAENYADKGNQHYADGLAFADEYRLPLGAAFALLAGTVTFTNCKDAFHAGEFVITDRDWADSVASLFVAMKALCKGLNCNRFLEACMAVCRVKEFDSKRLLSNASRHYEVISRQCGTRDGYLEVLEEVYNKGRTKFPLKIEAQNAMRSRSGVEKAKAKAKKGSEPAAAVA